MFNTLYSIFMCVWVCLFKAYWKRYESGLQVKWGVLAKRIYKQDRNFDFQGIKRTKCTTFEEEEDYSKAKRFYLYLISLLEAFPLLFLALGLKIIIFNLSGLINDTSSVYYVEIIAN